MAAYLVAFAKVKNAARLPEYASAAGQTLAAAGGTVVTRGKVRALVGGFAADTCLVVKFPDAAAVEAWYRSPQYQKLAPVRDEVMDPTFFLLEEPT